MSCGVGRRWYSNPTLLWLWRGPAATAPIRPLAWDPPYAEGMALKRQKGKKKKKKNLSLGIPWWPKQLRTLCCLSENVG